MTGSQCTAVRCDRPVGDNAYLCGNCRAALERSLGNIPALYADLQITITRQAQSGSEIGRHVKREVVGAWWEATGAALAALMPFPAGPSDLDWVTRNTLSTWCRDVAEDSDVDLPADSVPAMAVWLIGRLGVLAHRQSAAEAAEEISWLASALLRAVDRPPERAYAGPCDGCGEDLYARLGAQSVRCVGCSRTYDAAARRKWLLAEAEDVLAHAALLARAITVLREPIEARRIRVWATRGLISERSTDRTGRPLYRVGDVLDLLARMSTKAIRARRAG